MKKFISSVAALLLALAVPACSADLVSVVTGGLLSAPTEGTSESQETEQAAQEDTGQPFSPSNSDTEANSKRLAEIEQLLAEWEKLTPEEAAARFEVTADDVANRVTLLTSLKNSYPRIESSLARKAQDDAELQKQKADTTPPELSLTDKPPYTLSYHDAFVSTLGDLRRQYAEGQDNANRAQGYAEMLRVRASETEAAWRLARDTYQKTSSAANQWKMDDAALEVEYIRALQILDAFSRDHTAAALETYGIRLNRQLALQKFICGNLDLSEESYNAEIAELNDQIKALEERRPHLTRRLRQAETLAENADLACSSLSSAASDAEKDAAKLDLDYRSADRDSCRTVLEQLQETLVLLAARKRIWTLRYDISRGAVDRTTIPDTIKKLQTEAAAMDDALMGVQRQLLALQVSKAAVDKALDSSEADQKTLATLKNYRAAIQSAIDSCLEYTSTIIAVEAQELHLIEDLREEFKTVSVVKKAGNLWKKHAQDALATELWQSGGYTVRLQEFLTAFALIVFGMWGARRAMRVISWFAARRFKFDETSRRLFDRFLSFTAGVIVFIVALHIVGIPLAAFAFLGGAVAIAVGFGAQDLFKNLMSGIMLALNRSFRLGDTVEVAGISGTVTDIGMRCTVIRTFDEKEVVLPNSDLIANKLVNWSLSDALLRVELDFGVEYGTPVKKVRETVLRLVEDNPKILKKPAPWVCFVDFADSEMQFRLYYWINQKLASGLRLSSELREAIIDAFNREGIEMAYPHLNVNLIKPQTGREEPPGDPARS